MLQSDIIKRQFAEVLLKLQLLPVVIAAVLVSGLALPPDSCGARNGTEMPKPESRTERKMEGWTVLIDDRMFLPANEALCSRSLKYLEAKLHDIKSIASPEITGKLQTIKIVLDFTHGKLHSMQYHPDAGWLKNNGYSTNLVKCVHIPDASDLVTFRTISAMPWVILHELAHAYHDQFLDFENPGIMKAYEAFKKSGHGDKALLYNGNHVRHYGLTDQKEFFAEMTEAYFGLNDFFPFTRGELMTSEPEIYELIKTVWGPLSNEDHYFGASKNTPTSAKAAITPAWYRDSAAKIETELSAKYGDGQKARIRRGLEQVGKFWRAEDGEAAVFEEFARKNFTGDQATLDTLFARFEHMFEKIGGHLTELRYEFRLQTDCDLGPILPVDETFAAYEPGAHLNDDFFGNKVAFMVLLNFPLCKLDQLLAESSGWSRRQWAEARLAQQFSKRIPADVQQVMSAAQSEAEIYISEYKVCMHHVLDEKGERMFPAKLRLLSHWGLRDELKAQYSNGTNGLPRQRMIMKIMERVIDQSIPAAVINNPKVDWNPVSNEVKSSPVMDFEQTDSLSKSTETSNAAEPDTRYAKLLTIFQACRKVDPYSPTAPTLIARRFEEDRQMSEDRVKAMLEKLLTSTQFAEVGRLIEKRLGRPLEPFDIWYNGFRPRDKYPEAKLDEIVRKKYPTADAFHDGIPAILKKLGFSSKQAEFLKDNISVQRVRGCGHAMGGAMRGQKARLRTGIQSDGMNYQGFNTAMHELGHNIEQTFSLNLVDSTLMQGVPNTAFTEGLAMLMQGHDLDVLDLAKPDARTEALATLNEFWATCEIAGMALTDMAVWHWMYDHPDATPAELKAATIVIARDIWNKYYAPVFKQRDVILPAIYSHMINCILYIPDYPIGHLIGFQIEEQMKKVGKIGPAFESITKQGNITPDLWMKTATGAPVGPEAMLNAAKKALDLQGK